MSRSLDDLKPEVKALAERWLAECKDQGLDVLVTSTLRTFAEQDALYAQGRTAPGRIVTNARGGQSFHNFGVALDFVPMRNGKPVWGYSSADDSALWSKIAGIAEGLGFSWSGRWTGKLKEQAHIQFTSKTLAQLNAEAGAA